MHIMLIAAATVHSTQQTCYCPCALRHKIHTSKVSFFVHRIRTISNICCD